MPFPFPSFSHDAIALSAVIAQPGSHQDAVVHDCLKLQSTLEADMGLPSASFHKGFIGFFMIFLLIYDSLYDSLLSLCFLTTCEKASTTGSR